MEGVERRIKIVVEYLCSTSPADARLRKLYITAPAKQNRAAQGTSEPLYVGHEHLGVFNADLLTYLTICSPQVSQPQALGFVSRHATPRGSTRKSVVRRLPMAIPAICQMFVTPWRLESGQTLDSQRSSH